MTEQRPLTWELALTGFIIIGMVCAGCFLTTPRWAHLLPTLPARAARDPSPTAAPTFTAIPTPTREKIPDTPTLTLTPLPVPVLTFGTARPVPLIPIPTPTPSFTATPIPLPTSTPLILFAPTWPVVNPTYTPWIGPTATSPSRFKPEWAKSPLPCRRCAKASSIRRR